MAYLVNRAERLWNNWEEKEGKLGSIPDLNMDDRENKKFKYDFLKKGLYRISNPSEREKLYIHVIKTVTAKLEKQLYPRLWQRILHRSVRLIKRTFYLRTFEKMQQENLKELNEQLNSKGLKFFGSELKRYLDYESQKINIEALSLLEDNSRLKVNVELEQDDLGSYALKNYTTTLIDRLGHITTAKFSADSQINLNEAVNLLKGRSILKSYKYPDGTIDKKWIQLDFTNSELKLATFSPTNDYDLGKILIDNAKQLGIIGIRNEAVQRSLEQGNLVGFELPEIGKFYMQSNPANNELKFSNSENKTISFQELKTRKDEFEQFKTAQGKDKETQLFTAVDRQNEKIHQAECDNQLLVR